MSRLSCTELPYDGDSLTLFQRLAGRPWAGWLDSAGCDRFDILVAEPRATLVTRGPVTTVCAGDHCRDRLADPLELLREALGPPRPAVVPGVPFGGGALGYFSYDLARRWFDLPLDGGEGRQPPEMTIGIYDWALVVDREQCRCRLVAQNDDALARARRLFAAMPDGAVAPVSDFWTAGEVTGDTPWPRYRDAYARIRRYLHDGDCYQINFAQRFRVNGHGDPFALYRRLRSINPAPFGAYLNYPFAQVLSTSPERFLRVQGRRVETRPIKGTRARAADPAVDALRREALGNSAKDRAENLMIVDLLRNDLGKCCVPGSVAVPDLFAVESFATVHHLVSTVVGELAEGKDAIALLRDCFPGGSITGAPKRRAMAIIDELEACRRGVYCGAIGYIGFDGAMDTNIAIRTALHHEGAISLAAGGGIVMDSNAADEYQESLDKAAALLQSLQQCPRRTG